MTVFFQDRKRIFKWEMFGILFIILFGSFLELSGAAGFFMDTAFAVAGRTRGGPAKVAVLASGLFGMVNGTSTGNVVTTGTLTIPMIG